MCCVINVQSFKAICELRKQWVILPLFGFVLHSFLQAIGIDIPLARGGSGTVHLLTIQNQKLINVYQLLTICIAIQQSRCITHYDTCFLFS